MNLNEVYISGFLGSDPKSIKSEKAEFAAANVAIPSSYFDKDKKEWVENEPSWVDVLAFKESTIKNTLSAKRGDKVLVRGYIKSQKKEIGGKNITVQKVIATSFSTLGKTQDEASPKGSAEDMDFDEAWEQ